MNLLDFFAEIFLVQRKRCKKANKSSKFMLFSFAILVFQLSATFSVEAAQQTVFSVFQKFKLNSL